MTDAIPLILASASPYRRALLQRLGVAFECLSPDIDETPAPGEAAAALVRRLARAKADAVAAQRPHCLIIASDQVADQDGEILTKPGTRARAQRQLAAMAGREVRFLTGLCVLNGRSGGVHEDCVVVTVTFRELTAAEIDRYLEADSPYDCAGSFKSESLGIALLSGMAAPDPTALVGLPLIRLAGMLRSEGLPVP